MAEEPLATSLLEGVRILDITTVVMGPLATMLLGDLGADVIKVEAPGGDISRQSIPTRSRGMGQAFLAVNRNKRSIAIDLKTDEGRKAVLALAKTADVLVYNIRPQSMTRLGLGYEQIAAINPRMVYVGGFGFSQRGPYAARPAYDDVLQGLIGVPWLFAKASGKEPRYAPMTFADRAVALHIVMAVLGGLYHVQRTGSGQRIDVPMFENLAMMVLGEHLEGETFVPAAGHMGHARSISQERRPYQTKDGYLCVLIYNDTHWKRFLQLVGRPELFETDRFCSHSARIKHVNEVYGFLADALQQRTTAEWLAALGECDIPAGPMNSLEDLLQDEHLNSIGYYKQVDHPTEGTIRTVMYPTEWSGVETAYRRHAPALGEHSRDILQECGYSETAIEELVQQGVVKVGAKPQPRPGHPNAASEPVKAVNRK